MTYKSNQPRHQWKLYWEVLTAELPTIQDKKWWNFKPKEDHTAKQGHNKDHQPCTKTSTLDRKVCQKYMGSYGKHTRQKSLPPKTYKRPLFLSIYCITYLLSPEYERRPRLLVRHTWSLFHQHLDEVASMTYQGYQTCALSSSFI